MIEIRIHTLKFPNEEFNPDDYNDWVRENAYEAYSLCLKVAQELGEEVNELSKFDER